MSSRSRTITVCSIALTAALFVANADHVFAQTQSGTAKTVAPEKRQDGTWESLKPAQQKILAPLESDWDYMLPSLKFPAEKKAEAWTAYQKLSDEQKKIG